MKRRLLIVTALFVPGFALVGGLAFAGSGNDRVLKEEDYVEVFKKEGNGDKNYLYTITEFEDEWGRLCTVVSGDSEKTMALDCTDSRRNS